MTKAYSAISALAIAVALAVAGCGGGSSSGESGAYGSGESAGSTQAASGESGGGRYGGGPSSSAASGSGAVSVASVGDVGKVLVDSEGLTLYYFEKDKGGKSACYGACASAWPPLTTSGTPHAMGGVESAKIGTTKRKDGTLQVTYAGWPLYTYTADTKPGEDNGTDVDAFGGAWYPLHPDGEKAGD
jgi:predicted lipoprotein with Yx(FWY)xxD motif